MAATHCPCRFRLPLQYNDGREVEPEVLAKIFTALTVQFGGYTPLGSPTEGDWGGRSEPMTTIEVAVLPERIAELRAVVYAIGKELGQKQMYFDAPSIPSVEFMDIDEEDEAAGS